MAEHHEGDHRLIEQYLAGLRRSLGERTDADDVVDELRDHLLATSERHRRSGASPDDADRAAVRELGDADLVAASFRSGDRGGAAVPTTFTRLAGLAGLAAAGSGVLAAVAFAIGDRVEDADGYWSPESQAWGTIGAIATLLTALGLLVLLVGLVRRHGGLGAAGTAAVVLGSTGALASVIAWAVPAWGTLVAASWVVLAVALRGRALAHRRAVIGLAAALAVIPVAAVASDGGPAALLLAADAVAVVVAAGCASVLGRSLASEAPVAVPDRLAAA